MMYKNDNCDYDIIWNNNDLYNNTIRGNININTNLKTRYDVLNNIIHEYSYFSYLEIGVETGTTFKNIKLDMSKKVGVDPDPSYKADNIVLKTSVDFFKDNTKTFDIIFINPIYQK